MVGDQQHRTAHGPQLIQPVDVEAQLVTQQRAKNADLRDLTERPDGQASRPRGLVLGALVGLHSRLDAARHERPTTPAPSAGDVGEVTYRAGDQVRTAATRSGPPRQLAPAHTLPTHTLPAHTLPTHTTSAMMCGWWR